MMRRALKASLLVVSFLALCGCVATAPLKVAGKTAKLGAKTAAAGVKATAKAGGALIPSDEKADEEAD